MIFCLFSLIDIAILFDEEESCEAFTLHSQRKYTLLSGTIYIYCTYRYSDFPIPCRVVCKAHFTCCENRAKYVAISALCTSIVPRNALQTSIGNYFFGTSSRRRSSAARGCACSTTETASA